MAPPTASTSNLRLTASSAAALGDDNEFIQFRAKMRLPIAPIWGSDGKSGGGPNGSGGMDGVREVLAGWVMRSVLCSLRRLRSTRADLRCKLATSHHCAPCYSLSTRSQPSLIRPRRSPSPRLPSPLRAPPARMTQADSSNLPGRTRMKMRRRQSRTRSSSSRSP